MLSYFTITCYGTGQIIRSARNLIGKYMYMYRERKVKVRRSRKLHIFNSTGWFHYCIDLQKYAVKMASAL